MRLRPVSGFQSWSIPGCRSTSAPAAYNRIVDPPRSRTTTAALMLGITFIFVICLAFFWLVWQSEGAIWLKLLASLGLLAMVTGGSIRLVVASRPYGNPQ